MPGTFILTAVVMGLLASIPLQAPAPDPAQAPAQPGFVVRKSGSVNAGQSFSRNLSAAAKFTQSITSIAKMNDFKDTLTNFTAGITTSVVSKLELKFEFVDTYKNKPPVPGIEKNDTALVMAFVWKYGS